MSSPDLVQAGDWFEIALRETGLPPNPAVLAELRLELAQQAHDRVRITELLSADVAIAIALIRSANEKFSPAERVGETIHDAISMLGLDLVISALTSRHLESAFGHFPCLERFWDRSARNARLSAWIAERVPGRPVAVTQAYTFGLLRNIGIPLLMAPFPEYRSVLARANQNASAFTAIEDDSLGLNHAVIGAGLLQHWLDDPRFCLAVRRHHDLEFLRRNDSANALPRCLIAISTLASRWLQSRISVDTDAEWVKLGPACLEILGWTEEDLTPLWVEVQAVMPPPA